ncbi:helix-turn-helix domain-containing protein [Pseudonocardia benzenivorans]
MVDRGTRTVPGEGRRGVGPTVPAAELPRSAHEARVALRFTADGTAADPGPASCTPTTSGRWSCWSRRWTPGHPDRRPERAARGRAGGPHLLRTSTALVASASVRAAAAELYVHHSTLQDRLDQAERVLGWSVRTTTGRARLQLVLAERLLRR